jgi:hypothetical protein
MDLYRLTVDYLLTFYYFDSWHEMKTILRRAASTRPRDWQRPIVAFPAVRGSLEKAIAASTVLDCAQLSFIADEAAYWRLVQNKNAPFYECALHLGYFWRKLQSKASARQAETI